MDMSTTDDCINCSEMVKYAAAQMQTGDPRVACENSDKQHTG